MRVNVHIVMMMKIVILDKIVSKNEENLQDMARVDFAKIQNVQAMQTVQMDKYVMMKVNVHIAMMMKNVILDKNVLIMFVKIQNAQIMQTVQMDKYVI